MEELFFGVYKIPLTINGIINITKEQLEKKIKRAQLRLKEFSVKYGWEDYIKEPFLKNVFIYDKQSKLINKLVEISNLNKEDFPEKISAVINNKNLYILSPENYLRVYPEGEEVKSYEKLITHELAHELHMRILGGKEELMGPIWFYEGFAVFAADQFKNYKLETSEIWEVINSEKRITYKYYGAIIRFLLNKVTLNQLVKKAKKEDFVDWVKNLY
ncbi:MAG: hypothetical protein R6V14_02060 [Halanaerobiales bacterium]